MKALSLALLLWAPVLMAQEARDKFALLMFQQPNGTGFAFLIGPTSAKQCAAALQKMVDTTTQEVPPNYPLQRDECIERDSGDMRWLTVAHCEIVKRQDFPGNDVKDWIYQCDGYGFP